MPGTLKHIHIVRVKRGDPEPIAEALLAPGRGVPGDHHDRPGIKRAVTLIRDETIADVGRGLGIAITAGSSRRNLTTAGIDLDSLEKGTRLVLGGAELEVTGPCDPCNRMEKALGPGALAIMQGRGGVVARVLREGLIRPGDSVRVVRGSGALFAVTETRTGKLQQGLLNWFRAAQRDLPWRRTKDPYSVWISEIMCQQTQVATVIPYWERFLARFPDVKSLAAAPVDDVLALWSGLGYYARARNLHRAGQAVVERHAGIFPADIVALQALPGFGPYTAGAVGSIALGLDAPIVDGNVARVLCRVEGWELGSEAARERAWEAAPALIPKGHAGDWNQALMELGATVCVPAAPKCDECPVRPVCAAARRGDPERYPLPKIRRTRKLMRFAALAVRDDNGIVLIQRAGKGLFGGLWELPSTELDPTAEGVVIAKQAARGFFARAAKVELLGRVAQALTHRDVEVEVYAASGSSLRLPEGARLVTPPELPSLGLSTLAVKVLAVAGVTVPGTHGRRRAPVTSQGSLFE